jgi:hypothetical protein
LTIEEEKTQMKKPKPKNDHNQWKMKNKKSHGNKSFLPSTKKLKNVSRVGDSVMWSGLSGNWIVSFIIE